MFYVSIPNFLILKSNHLPMAGPVESVWLLRFWPDQFFLKVKAKFQFLQKESNKQSSSVILGLIRLIILSYNR